MNTSMDQINVPIEMGTAINQIKTNRQIKNSFNVTN